MAWTLNDVEDKFLRYMQDNGHVLIEGHSVLSPTEDVLFTFRAVQDEKAGSVLTSALEVNGQPIKVSAPDRRSDDRA